MGRGCCDVLDWCPGLRLTLSYSSRTQDWAVLTARSSQLDNFSHDGFPTKNIFDEFCNDCAEPSMADMAGSFQSILQKVCLSPGWLKTNNSQLTHSGLVLPPSPTITQHQHINQNINNGITPRPPLPSQQAGSQYIIVVPLSAGTKVMRILLMSVPSLCWVFVVQGPVSCPWPVTGCPAHWPGCWQMIL